MEEINYDVMRYELDELGYLKNVFFGCASGECTGYTGTIPSGYETLQDWYEDNCDSINAWKIVENTLLFDNARYEELEEVYDKQQEDNRHVCHKELFEVQEQIDEIKNISDSQYMSKIATGDMIVLDDCKKCFPRFKFTNIKCYDFNKINLIVSGKNMLVNEALTQTINGIEFTQNKDRSITLKGTATQQIEYNIAGTSSNTSAFLCFKKGKKYCLSGLGDITVRMYYYNGTEKEEVYSGNGGIITFANNNKLVTQIVISINSGTTVNTTIYPQLEYGTVATDYEKYVGNRGVFDFSSFVSEGLFPSDTSIKHSSLKTGTTKAGISKVSTNIEETVIGVFPSNTLYPTGDVIDYVEIEEDTMYVSRNGVLQSQDVSNSYIYDNYSLIYTIEPTNIEIEYSSSVLKVKDLEFLQGKSTTTDRFKILEDGSIEANNGKFSGEVTATSGTIGGCSINDGVLEVENANIKGTISTSKLDSDVITTNNFSAQEINADKITSGTLSADYIDGGTINASSINLSGVSLSPSYSSIGGLSIANGNISNSRLGIDGSDGIIKVFNSSGGSMILSNAARLSATAGIGLTSNSNGNVSAPSVNLDLKACSGATAYLACMGTAAGTTEKSACECADGVLKLRSTGTIYANGVAIGGSSSRATKKNIKDLSQEKKTELYNLVKNIPLKEYDYKVQYGKEENYGFIIEDIEDTKLNTLLHVVQNEQNEDIKNYSSEDLTRLELVVIQELMKKIETLENRIKELEEK